MTSLLHRIHIHTRHTFLTPNRNSFRHISTFSTSHPTPPPSPPPFGKKSKSNLITPPVDHPQKAKGNRASRPQTTSPTSNFDDLYSRGLLDNIKACYLSSPGYESNLTNELSTTNRSIASWHGSLALSNGIPLNRNSRTPDIAWAADTWYEPKIRKIKSIKDAMRVLKSELKNWTAVDVDECRARVGLIQSCLPKSPAEVPISISAKPPSPSPPSPSSHRLGMYTLLTPTLLLYSTTRTSPHKNPTNLTFAPLTTKPPSSAYKKLHEAFAFLDKTPSEKSICVDLGSSPGGWTYVLSELGCFVLSVDKAELDEGFVSELSSENSRVTIVKTDAFKLTPDGGVVNDFIASSTSPKTPIQPLSIDYLFTDIACFPSRITELIKPWLSSNLVKNFVISVKLQGSDVVSSQENVNEIVAMFDGQEGRVRIRHLSCQGNEVMVCFVRDF